MTQHFKSKGGQWASFARNRNRMAKFAKGATSFQRLLYIISIRLFNLFNQAIETYMIKRQFLEIKLACRAIQLRLICIPRQLIFLKWSNVTNDPMSQMIQCNASNDRTTFEKGFSSSFNACDNQGLVCIWVFQAMLRNILWTKVKTRKSGTLWSANLWQTVRQGVMGRPRWTINSD